MPPQSAQPETIRSVNRVTSWGQVRSEFLAEGRSYEILLQGNSCRIVRLCGT
jgi:hypothetical protein